MARVDVSRELRRIQITHGGLLRAADVVAEASRPDSPLHDYFEWDDDAAAVQWRLQQARHLIRVTVEVLPYEEPHYHVRTYVSLTPDRVLEGGGYRVMTEVLRNPSERQQLLSDALSAMAHFREKYRQLSELSAIFAAMERAERSLEPAPPPESRLNDAATL